ncbi:MAG: glycosyltransferase, partial [Planctomycetota bacterium]|nr:glycosyltransferase [Planctomycetota bacterium]
MTSEPLVSIITPTYNHEKYIAECIRSAIAQTYQNWEMLIIDDGSTDRTGSCIASFLSDKRIKYIHQEHLGPYHLKSAYNKALSQARGELIAILEGDDFWPPDKLAIQTPYFFYRGVVLTYGHCILTNESGQRLFLRKIPSDENIRDNNPIGMALQEFLKGENFIYAQTVMVRRDALLKIGGFSQPEYLHLVDYPTWCKLSLEGEFRGIAHPLGFWRRNIKSITLTNPLIISKSFIRYIIEFIDQNLNQLHKLYIMPDLPTLHHRYREQLEHYSKHQNYTKGVITM